MPEARESPEPLSRTVVETLASVEGVSPTELDEPLFSSVDPDALDSLFTGSDGRVTFVHDGYLVTVSSDGDVAVERVDRSSSAATGSATSATL
jgi:hypothetical protein